MKWLVVSPENQGEETKSIVKVLEENKVDFFVLKMNDASEKLDLDSNEMGKFTHCVFGCNPVVSNGFSMLLLGYFAGKKAPVYMTKCDAAIFNGADSLAETGKGFSQDIMVVGLCETIALFSMVFGMIAC